MSVRPLRTLANIIVWHRLLMQLPLRHMSCTHHVFVTHHSWRHLPPILLLVASWRVVDWLIVLMTVIPKQPLCPSLHTMGFLAQRRHARA